MSVSALRDTIAGFSGNFKKFNTEQTEKTGGKSEQAIPGTSAQQAFPAADR